MSVRRKSSKFEPRPYFIAYIDVLGYKEKVNNGDVKLAEAIDSILKSAISIAAHRKGADGVAINKDIKVKAFSDNVIICTKKHWDILLIMMGHLQSEMIGKGYFIRGAMCHSMLHFDRRFVFGKGVIVAHEIESKIAKVPRIIVHSSYRDAVNALDDKIFDIFIAVAGAADLCIRDRGYMFLSYLGIVSSDLTENFDVTLDEHRQQIISNIEDCEKGILPPDTMEKFQWCLQYHNRFCEENGYEKYLINKRMIM